MPRPEKEKRATQSQRDKEKARAVSGNLEDAEGGHPAPLEDPSREDHALAGTLARARALVPLLVVPLLVVALLVVALLVVPLLVVPLLAVPLLVVIFPVVIFLVMIFLVVPASHGTNKVGLHCEFGFLEHYVPSTCFSSFCVLMFKACIHLASRQRASQGDGTAVAARIRARKMRAARRQTTIWSSS